MDNFVCDHRSSEDGTPLQTWRHRKHLVCKRCVHRVREDMNPIKMGDWLRQANFAQIEMRAMTAMMREVGIEFFNDEAMGTAEQFEEFKRRWMEKYPDRSFMAMYGSKPD